MKIQVKVLAREISEYLWGAGKTVATAESCTSGLVASCLTSIPGASAYFRGGIIAYADEVKQQLLDVDPELLAQFGAVSEPVARAMVEGAIEKLGTDYVISVTGYAGPTGGPEATVGTIFVAVGTRTDIEVRQLTGDDGREENVARATLTALKMLLERLEKDFPRISE